MLLNCDDRNGGGKASILIGECSFSRLLIKRVDIQAMPASLMVRSSIIFDLLRNNFMPSLRPEK